MEKTQTIIKAIKKRVLQLLRLLLKPCILFESYPPFSDNTRAVYDEFVRRGYDKKYKLIWYLDDATCVSFTRGKEVRWDPTDGSTLIRKIRNYGFHFKTKAIICCNRFLASSGYPCPVEENMCKSFYLSHGTPIKRVEDYYYAPEGIDYAISPAKAITEIMARSFKIDTDKYAVTGFPRNDAFFKEKVDLHKRIEGDYKKIVLWYPTYRQHNKNSAIASKGSPMPLIHDAEKAVLLNETAKENDVLILFKPHFAQHMAFLRDLNLSNLRRIDDAFIAGLGVTPYEFLASSDAMITDYSSVYFDYTLCDKPIAVIWEDIDDYRQFPGFAIDLEQYMKGAEKIYSIEELCRFIEDVSNGIDRRQMKRSEVRDLTNDFRDGKSAERAVDFIIDKADLH